MVKKWINIWLFKLIIKTAFLIIYLIFLMDSLMINGFIK